MLWSVIKFSQLILKEMYGDQSGELECGFLGLKALVNYKYMTLVL